VKQQRLVHDSPTSRYGYRSAHARQQIEAEDRALNRADDSSVQWLFSPPHYMSFPDSFENVRVNIGNSFVDGTYVPLIVLGETAGKERQKMDFGKYTESSRVFIKHSESRHVDPRGILANM
jgi:hypothetical protein